MNIFALDLARIPNVSLKVMLRLAKTLLRDAPTEQNAVIMLIRDDLAAQVESVNEALVARTLAGNPELVASEVDFDLGVDGLWVLLFRRLQEHGAYLHPGLDLLPEELAEAAQLELSRERARKAQRLLARVFGSGTIAELIKAPFVEQVESMAVLLRLIDEEGLRKDFEDVVGAALMQTLDACQHAYEDMIDSRLRRQKNLSLNLSTLRSGLRWALVAYVNAVHSLYRPNKPETAALVLEHLQPILTLRERLARAGGAEAEAELDVLAELELPELDSDGVELGLDEPNGPEPIESEPEEAAE